MQAKSNWDTLCRPSDTDPISGALIPEALARWTKTLADDMTEEWKVGRPILVEEYLRHLPDLGDEPDAVEALVDAEHELRVAWGAGVSNAVYEARLRAWLPNLSVRVTPKQNDFTVSLPQGLKRIAGRYALVDSLGPRQTGQARGVYLARDEWLGRYVTLKLSDLEADDTTVSVQAELAGDISFQREAQFGATLDHPHFGRVLDVGVDGDFRYLALEYVPGPALAIYAQEPLLAPLLVIRLVKSLADALDNLHARDVWYCDLKLHNVLFHSDGRLVVIDLGALRRWGDEAGFETPVYSAPEGQTHPGSDVFSLGVILFQLLTGAAHPFGNSSNKHFIDMRNLGGFDPYPSEAGVEPRLAEIGRRCLACHDLNFKARYQNMREVSLALQEYERQNLADFILQREQILAGQQKRRRRKVLVTGLVFGLVILGGGWAGGWWTQAAVRQAANPLRVTVGPLAMQRAMHLHLEPLTNEMRSDVRFVVLTHRHNNPDLTAAELDRDRATLAELLGALAGVAPDKALRAVDEQRTIFALSLSELGWDAWLWDQLRTHYPYKMLPAVGANQALQVESQTGSDQPAVRADWLVGFLSEHPARVRFLGRTGGQVPAVVKKAGQDYVRDSINLKTAAVELGLASTDNLEDAILNGRLPAKLKPLVNQDSILRRDWESSEEDALSPFHQAVNVLSLGTIR